MPPGLMRRWWCCNPGLGSVTDDDERHDGICSEYWRLALNAWSRLQIKPAALEQQHMFQLRMEGNLLQADWSCDGITLWTEALTQVALTQGTATYSHSIQCGDDYRSIHIG